LLSTGPIKFVISAVSSCCVILPCDLAADTCAGASVGAGVGVGAGAGAGVGAGACRLLVLCRGCLVGWPLLSALPPRRSFAIFCLSCNFTAPSYL
jgi:hypothetical protein